MRSPQPTRIPGYFSATWVCLLASVLPTRWHPCLKFCVSCKSCTQHSDNLTDSMQLKLPERQTLTNGAEASQKHSEEQRDTRPSHHCISPRSIVILSNHLCLGLHRRLSPSGFPISSLLSVHISHSCYMSFQSHPLLLCHSNYTWRRVQFIVLLLTQLVQKIVQAWRSRVRDPMR
jgi:hypothetical protein